MVWREDGEYDEVEKGGWMRGRAIFLRAIKIKEKD